MTGEEWRDIPGFPEYQVSDRARVRSLKTYNRPDGRPVLLAPYLAENGYYYVKLLVGRKAHNPTLHKLVTAAFIGPRPEGMVVRHIDGDPTNNVPANLRYGTHSQNNDDSVRHGTHPEASKTQCKRGHEFTGENTRVERRPNGRSARRCLTCQREYDAARAARRSVA